MLDNDYRHPVVLAKELATVDLLSDGRLEIGIGAGWMRTDYDAAGIGYDPASVRVDRFLEALAVLKGLMDDGPLTVEGTHYTVTSLDGLPKPLQRPHPPILIGGGGRRVLSIAAREADIVGINGTMRSGAIDSSTMDSLTAKAVDDKVAIVRDVAGDRLDELELNVRAFFVAVTNDRNATAGSIGELVGFPADDILETPFALIGTPSQIADDLRERRERWGFSYIIVGPDDVDSFAPVVAELTGA